MKGKSSRRVLARAVFGGKAFQFIPTAEKKFRPLNDGGGAGQTKGQDWAEDRWFHINNSIDGCQD
jgi:hypothetical protein